MHHEPVADLLAQRVAELLQHVGRRLLARGDLVDHGVVGQVVAVDGGGGRVGVHSSAAGTAAESAAASSATRSSSVRSSGS